MDPLPLSTLGPLPTWILLALAGVVAGVINTLAGGGSLLTVPLLVFFGLPPTIANGTNRVGVLVQNLASTLHFRRAGVGGVSEAIPVLVPVLVGSVIGAALASRMPDEIFRRVFGIAMIALLYPMLRPPRPPSVPARAAPRSRLLNTSIFFGIGLYGGAIQAGVGLFLVAALARSGLDLVRASAIKVVLIGSLTLVAVPVFVLHGQVQWLAASALVVGFAAGGELGARAAIGGGERLIRVALVIAVLVMAGRMLELY